MSDINENRGLFGLHGITGFLVATIVLVIVVLSWAYVAYFIQVENATTFYDIKDRDQIKMISVDNAKHVVIVEHSMELSEEERIKMNSTHSAFHIIEAK